MNNAKSNYDKNSKIIVIPEGTTEIKIQEFENFSNLEKIIIPNSVLMIHDYAFSNCKNLKKINLPNNLKHLGNYVFWHCSSLEEITIPESINYISEGLFGNCSKLKQLNLPNNINYIGDFGLYNCRKLTNFNLPENITSLGIKSLFGCNKIKEIHIPKSLTHIDYAALSLMSSLTKITVDKDNPQYIDQNNIALLDKKSGSLIQYAINCKEKEFTVGYYMNIVDDSELPFSYDCVVHNISDYAFAGAKYLEKILISSAVHSIGAKTFLNCNKLKDLNVFFVPFGRTLSFNIPKLFIKKICMPFENIEIDNGITTLSVDMYNIFINAKKVTLPKTLESINGKVFYCSKKLEQLTIPSSVKSISPNTFNNITTLNFEDFGKIKPTDFNMLQTKSNSKFDIKALKKDIKILSLKNGIYYIKINDYDPIEITKNEIQNFSKSSYLLIDKPDVFIEYLYEILSINNENDTLISNIVTDPKLKSIFTKFASDFKFVTEIADIKYNKTIRELLSSSELNNEIIFNGIIMRNLDKKDLLCLINNNSPSLENFLKKYHFFDLNITLTPEIHLIISNFEKTVKYCNLLEKYNKRDKFLYNTKFYINLSLEQQEELIKNFNNNLKRLIISSNVLEDSGYNDCNLKDLLNLLNIMGAFSDNEVLSQRVTTFMTEKLFLETLPNCKNNNYKIISDDIHTFFNELKPRNEIDLEFILFFIENYKDLIEIEKSTSGFIARTYNSFREISKCSTSDKGMQRHIKVTIDKCKNFFLIQNSHYISEDNEELAKLLSKYYSLDKVFDTALSILEESKNTYRNIFSSLKEDDSSHIIYNSNDDLQDYDGNEYHYQWLPKQDYDNFVLGKYCNCCAHIAGNGAGIMKASMILDNCQNLVIRDNLGNIIAKMTIYVNRKEGYAVFNTVEVSLNHKDENSLQKIYNAFIKGTEAFYYTYNKNNPLEPLHTITIGTNRNVIKDLLPNEQQISPYPVIDYSVYCYMIGDTIVGKYKGDAIDDQMIVLSKNTNFKN